MDRKYVSLWVAVVFLVQWILLGGVAAQPFTRVEVIIGDGGGVVQNSAKLLLERLGEMVPLEGSLQSVPAGPPPNQNTLQIFLGIPEQNNLLTQLMQKQHIRPLTVQDPGAEGFHLSYFSTVVPPVLMAASVDERGALYVVGEILRRVIVGEAGLRFDELLDIRTAPAFRIRGTEVSQGVTITELTGSRSWTEQEWQRAVLNYALAGANTFGAASSGPQGGGQYAFIKSYGLQTILCLTPNVGTGPPEWQAIEAIGRKNYLCPSISEARAALVAAAEQRVKNIPFYDYIRFNSGDGGGCECEKCEPFGKVYIHLCEEIARIIHKEHPQTRIMATQQKLNNAGDQAILDYLNVQPRTWLYAIAYGPGSNAMGWAPGRRQDHRMDLFQYPAFGPLDRYLRELLHQLPPTQTLVCFTDLTHWVYSQYGLVNWKIYPDARGELPPAQFLSDYSHHPDPALAQVYDRRTFHARPHAYYRVFQNTMRYTEGDITYSEGYHDHFNQWMWQRLLWNPQQTLEGVVHEYARTHFGPEAEEVMATAILQAEHNLSSALATNEGIDLMVSLLSEAMQKITPWRMERDHLWRQYMQKALLDQYLRARLLKQHTCQRDIEKLCKGFTPDEELDKIIAQAKQLLAEDIETEEMKALRHTAGSLGEESDRIYGVRSEGYFNLDVDLAGLGWYTKQLNRTKSMSLAEKREVLRQIADYESVGEGGYYDDAGDPARSPHLVHGWIYPEEDFSPLNRRSQNSCAYTQDASPGVTFRYEGLDPSAAYRVRFTFVRPYFLPRYADRHPQKTQSVYADEVCLVKDLEIPESEAEQFDFILPKEVTADGILILRLEKSATTAQGTKPEIAVWRNTGGWGTIVSEVWLSKLK